METALRTFMLEQTLVVLWLSSTVDPPADDFERGLVTIRQVMRERAIRGASVRSVIVTDGGAPDAKQRKDMAALWSGEPSKSAVISRSARLRRADQLCRVRGADASG